MDNTGTLLFISYLRKIHADSLLLSPKPAQHSNKMSQTIVMIKTTTKTKTKTKNTNEIMGENEDKKSRRITD